jgi:hypothetical protein
MHTVEMLEKAIGVAQTLGYGVRHEWLGGTGGGACEFGGRKWMFVDLALSVAEQLDQVAEGLRADPAIHLMPLPSDLRRLIDSSRAA